MNVKKDMYILFVYIFFSQRQFDKAFSVLEKILERTSIEDGNFRAQLKNFVYQNNLQLGQYPRISKFIME